MRANSCVHKARLLQAAESGEILPCGFSVQPVSLACRHGDLPLYFKT